MALQLQRCGNLRQDALLMGFKPPWEEKGGTRKTRLRAHADEVWNLSTESASGINLSERLNRLADTFVATPRYSSLLRLSRHRRHELKMTTRDRMFLSISDWVFRRVKDPLVEIDPVTVNQVMTAEKEAVMKESCDNSFVSSTSPGPSLFGYLPPGFPNGTKAAAFAVGIVLLLAAVSTAAIVALRGMKRSVARPLTLTAESNGSAREEVGSRSGGSNTSFSDTDSDEEVLTRVSPPVGTATSSNPVTSYSSVLEQSDLRPPHRFPFSVGTGEKKLSVGSCPENLDLPRGSETSDDKVGPFKLPLNGRRRPPPPLGADSILRYEETVVRRSNGAATANIAVKVSEVELREMVSRSSVILKEPDAAESHEKYSEGLWQIREHASIQCMKEELPPATEPVAAKLPEASRKAVYGRIGEDTSPSSNGELPAAEEPIAALPGGAGGGGPGNSRESKAALPATAAVGVSGDSKVPCAALPAAADVGVPGDSKEPIAALPAAADVGVLGEPKVPMAALPDAADVGVLGEPKVPIAALPAAADGGVAGELKDPTAADMGGALGRSGDIDVFGPNAVTQRRRAAIQALKKVLPAMTVGAGAVALSSFSGVDGALELVGFLGTANLLARDILWADKREQLMKEIRDIKDREQLVQFLKRRNIILGP